jgi:GTP pyrophosphokinase
LVQLKKGERSVYLEKAEKEIYKAAAKQNLDIKISSRAKHFYSIYQKMRKRGKAVDEIYDLLALRIICENQAACYALIGIVHTLWKPMEGRFKDYIAMPKTNGYQSLHTTVMCEGFPLEIQIRTQEMHSVAEHGVASHWLYKKGKSKDSVSVENLSIINHLKELKKAEKNDAELFAEIKDELLGDSIYVFTPQGDVRELPAGATAIDFAYSIHSRIGETIVGAKADGNIIPLSSPLKNTQIIEILTNPQSHPTENQLHSVKTSKARNKIRSWLLQNGAIINTQGTGTASALVQNSQKNATQDLSDKPLDKTVAGAEEEPIRIRIGDTTNFMVKSAKCCNPVFGDEIIGYVSRGRGLIIHRTGCENFLRIPNVEERSVSVIWEQKPIVVKGKKK